MNKIITHLAAIVYVALCTNAARAETEASGLHHGEKDGMMFQKLDTNGDGVVSKAEFNAFNARHFKNLDTNKDGKLTPEELQGGHKQEMGHGDATTHLDRRFNAADANKDGGLDRNEASNMPMLSQYFDDVDTNHDGKVTRQEYFDAMPLLHGAKKIDPSGKPQSM
ncbi:MAG: EF-hand domain-containing protein [Gallionella sp.]